MVAAFLVYNYVDGVEEDAMGNAKLVPVFTVEAPIARGASGEAAAEGIRQSNIPQEFKPANAITSLDDIAGKVAIGELAPNQVVVNDMFVDRSDPAARKSNTEYIRKIRNQDQVAVAIQVDTTRGVAALIEPGDYVSVMMLDETPPTAADGAEAPVEPVKAGPFKKEARYLYQKVEVLAVDNTFTPQAGQAAAGDAEPVIAQRGLITLIVTPKAAQYIASVDPSQLYLVLVSRDYKPVEQTPINANDPIPGENKDQLTPYGPEGPDNAS